MCLPDVLIAHGAIGGRQPVDVGSKAHVSSHIEREVRAKRVKGGTCSCGRLIRGINEVLDASQTRSMIRSISAPSIVQRDVLRRWENLVEYAGGTEARSVDQHSRQRGIALGIAPFVGRRSLHNPALRAFRGCVDAYRACP